MKFFIKILAILFFLTIVMVAAGAAYINHAYTAPGDHEEEIIFVVPRGASVGKIAQDLYDQRLISDPFFFKLFARFHDHTKMQAGEYVIPAYASIKEILGKIETGDVHLRFVTIPEGLTSYQIVSLLKDTFPNSENIDIPAEGSLMPDTYAYTMEDGPKDIIKRMQTAMDEVLNNAWAKKSELSVVNSKEEAIILASIIEKETAVNHEYNTVAGVFTNRLRIGMALQTDPTVIYAITKGQHEDKGQGPLGRRLLRKDLEVDDPYNTYKYAGLPPGPICNPGRQAIEAALMPEDNDFIYFVANGTGGHSFAKTLAEHNANVQKWRQIRKNSL